MHAHARACTYVVEMCGGAVNTSTPYLAALLCITILGSAGLVYVLIYTVCTASRTCA